MTKDQIISDLKSPSKCNEALCHLYTHKELIDAEIISAIADIISDHGSVDDTNSFASLLADIGSETFIPPLIKQITLTSPEESPWLTDYMYALIEILYEAEDFYPVSDEFVHRLGDWLLNTNGGELSWKAGDLLAVTENPVNKGYLLKGALDQSLFHLTRVSCLGGVMNQHRSDAAELIAKLEHDPDSRVQEMALDAKAFLAK